MTRVLITGASRGIGRGVAEELTARGHEVIATARDLSSLEDMPATVRLQLDVTDECSVRAAIEAAGPIDVLVSNAGAAFRDFGKRAAARRGLFRRRRAGEVVPRRQQSLPSVTGSVGRFPFRSRQRRGGGKGCGRRDR
jgi:NAD(P)-dependent dehydrogenase (short-subunit alcohol dehydrogenase family)